MSHLRMSQLYTVHCTVYRWDHICSRYQIWISKTWRHHQTLLPRTKGIQDHTALFAPAKVRAQFSIDQSSSTWSSRCRTMLPMSIAIQPQEGFSAPSLHYCLLSCKLKFCIKTFLGQDQRQPSYSCRLREQQKRQHWKESQGCGRRQGSPTWHAECSCLCQLSWSHSIVSPPALQWQQHLAAVTKIIFCNFIAIRNIACTLHTQKSIVTFSSLRIFTSSSSSKTPLKPLPYKQEDIF